MTLKQLREKIEVQLEVISMPNTQETRDIIRSWLEGIFETVEAMSIFRKWSHVNCSCNNCNEYVKILKLKEEWEK